MRHLLPILLFLMASMFLAGFNGPARAADSVAAAPEAKKQYVILKLDDIIQMRDARAIHPRWQKVSDYLEQNQIKASFGIICQSLEQDNPKYFAWIKERQASGNIEFWCHGYWLRPNGNGQGEWEHGTAEEQQAVFEKCEKLAREKLGFELVAFGPHWSGTTEETEKALQAVPEIKIWLYGPAKPKYYTKISYPRVMALENPTFVPDFDKFKQTYEKYGFRQNPLVLQGHAAMWDETRWAGFVAIIEYLKSKNVIFTTPSEYYAMTHLDAAK